MLYSNFCERKRTEFCNMLVKPIESGEDILLENNDGV